MTKKRSKQPEVCNLTQFAAYMGVTKQAVQKAKKDLVFDDKGKVLKEESKKLWELNERRISTSKAEERAEQAGALLDAKTQQAQLDVERKRFKLDLERGLYVDKQEAIRTYFEANRMIRDTVLSIPSKCAALICADLGVDVSNAHKVERLLNDQFRAMLNSLADKIQEI